MFFVLSAHDPDLETFPWSAPARGRLRIRGDAVVVDTPHGYRNLLVKMVAASAARAGALYLRNR